MMSNFNRISLFCAIACLSALPVAQVQAQSSQSAVCYQRSKGIIQVVSNNHYACNNTQISDAGHRLCCFTGDDCGKESICHYTHPADGGSGYYVGGCTDPTYKDPICSQRCTNNVYQDIVFNYTSGLWTCCGDYSTDCPNPTKETFQALPQSLWSALPSLPTSASTASSTSSHTSATNTASTTSANSAATSTPASSSGLSTGAQAGIGVGVGGAAAIAIGLAVFFLVRKRRNRNQQSTKSSVLMNTGLENGADAKNATPHVSGTGDGYGQPPHSSPVHAGGRLQEAPFDQPRVEAPSDNVRAEMAA